MPEPSGWILDFTDQDLPPAEWVELAGGKGTNLARMTLAGLPVPHGFILKTTAYTEFVSANRLQERILAALPPDTEVDPEVLETSSRAIRGLFAESKIPAGIETALLEAYRALDEPAVAVRSSATAEDTLELSFAGQQDTYLNVTGSEALIKAVIDCWSSLWTARAIGYRARNGVATASLALAVVVQRMVPSQVSGVLFTANPLTGLRSEMVIDAAFGLGEALVSGRVEPDQYIVDAAAEKIVKVSLGTKVGLLRGQAGGGTVWEENPRAAEQALSDERILDLMRLGKRVEALYGTPQDIEWALTGDTFVLLQSRPVTSLFPIPAGLNADQLKVMVSLAAIQGLLGPITPLGRDAFRWLFAMGGKLFGMHMTAENQAVIYEAGERLWINISTLLRNSVGRKVAAGSLEFMEPTVRQALNEVLDDPRLQPGQPGISRKAKGQIVRFAVPLAGNLLLNMIAPAARRKAIVGYGEKELARMQQRLSAVEGGGKERLILITKILQDYMNQELPPVFLRLVSGVAAGMASLNALYKLSDTLPNAVNADGKLQNHNLVLEISRSLPNNPTTEMDLELWQAANAVQKEPRLMKYFQSRSPEELGRLWKEGGLDPAAAAVFQPFIDRYGSRGLAEIDLGRSRWREDPTPVFSALEGFLQIQNGSQTPDAVFERGQVSAKQALNELISGLRRTQRGWIKVLLARFFAHRMRTMLCIRESPKFFAVRIFGQIRSAYLECGRDLVASGELDRADDPFFLSFKELEELASANPARDWREIIAGRRRSYDLEQHRNLIPRLLLSDGRAFYEGIQTSEGASDVISGSPVSPGLVEGSVRVVLDPHQAKLKPGEIMVCPGTDPSWTPLFLTAGGLIMEVCGMMTHGAVVAREYGIPAVVGVDRATRRLKTGARIRLDGSIGQILVLEES